MEFYSGKQPNLVGPVMQSTIDNITQTPIIGSTVSDKIMKCFKFIYDDYINYIFEHKLLFFILFIVVVLLVLRYNSVKNKNNQKELFYDNSNNQQNEKNLMKEIMEYQTNHLKYYNPPSMNPLFPEDNDEDIINYPPEPLPINLPNEGLIYTRDIYEKPQKTQFYNPQYNGNYEGSREYSTGLVNTYENAKDTDIPNPYGWSNNFNTNTGKFVKYMTDMNRMGQ